MNNAMARKKKWHAGELWKVAPRHRLRPPAQGHDEDEAPPRQSGGCSVDTAHPVTAAYGGGDGGGGSAGNGTTRRRCSSNQAAAVAMRSSTKWRLGRLRIVLGDKAALARMDYTLKLDFKSEII
jgi:hypothetical protein